MMQKQILNQSKFNTTWLYILKRSCLKDNTTSAPGKKPLRERNQTQPASLQKNSSTYPPQCILPSFSKNASRFFRRGFESV